MIVQGVDWSDGAGDFVEETGVAVGYVRPVLFAGDIPRETDPSAPLSLRAECYRCGIFRLFAVSPYLLRYGGNLGGEAGRFPVRYLLDLLPAFASSLPYCFHMKAWLTVWEAAGAPTLYPVWTDEEQERRRREAAREADEKLFARNRRIFARVSAGQDLGEAIDEEVEKEKE